MLLLLYRQTTTQTQTAVKNGNNVIDFFTSGDMENTPLRSRM